MQFLYYEFSVLAKAVHFKNLSAAALHVGLSQPQLSRIIARLEEEHKIVLLDRTAKRKSGWTPIAFELARMFESSAQKFASDIMSISNNSMVAELKIGTLEGMASIAQKVAKQCFDHVGIKKIYLDIYDLNELEANFLSGNLDLILSSKHPGRQKFKYIEEIGNQTLELIESSPETVVYSHFEFGRLNPKVYADFEHVLVSNSLVIRKEWLHQFGGTGHLPTEAKKGRAADKEPVLLIGSDLLSPLLWKEIKNCIT